MESRKSRSNTNESTLLLINKIMTIGRWVIEGAIAIYSVSLVMTMQRPDADGALQRFFETVMERFPLNDMQLTAVLIVWFSILIFIKVLLLKRTNFYESKLKFFMNIATMVFWIAFCAAWIIISALGVMGYVFYWFGIIPYQGIPIVNEMFSF